MISKDILNNNLNDAVSYYDFFKAFGYSDRDFIYTRTFPDKGRGEGLKFSQWLKDFSFTRNALKDENKKDRGVFFVVNGGGQSDSDVLKKVKRPKAYFIDNDELTFEQQIDKLNEFGLEPSIIIKTGRSLHAYWLTTEDAEMIKFRAVQAGLIEFFGSDPVIKNESRVMRLYGFEHRKHDPVLVKLIKFDPEIRYSQKEILENLISHGITTVDTGNGERKVSQDRVVGWDDRITDDSDGTQTQIKTDDLALAERNYSVKWFDRFCREYQVERLKRIERTDGNGDQKIITAVVCPWLKEHTDGDRSGSVVIVHQSGVISYRCQHSHCLDRDWKAFRSYFEEKASENVRSEALKESSAVESSTETSQNGSQGESETAVSADSMEYVSGLKGDRKSVV